MVGFSCVLVQSDDLGLVRVGISEAIVRGSGIEAEYVIVKNSVDVVLDGGAGVDAVMVVKMCGRYAGVIASYRCGDVCHVFDQGFHGLGVTGGEDVDECAGVSGPA